MTDTARLPDVYCANKCSWVGMEDDLISDDAGSMPHCPECDSSAIVYRTEDWEECDSWQSAVKQWRKENAN